MTLPLAPVTHRKERITLNATYTPSNSVADPQDAVAGFELQNDGDIAHLLGAVRSGQGAWLDPKVVNAVGHYECLYTLDSGTLTSSPGAASTWFGLETTLLWTRNRTTLGTNIAVITVHIRRKGTTTVLKSTTVTMTANVESGG